jgi:Helix-turn-helix domain/Peptidase S24-like
MVSRIHLKDAAPVRAYFAEWREWKGWSQQALAERMETTVATVSRIETGQRDWGKGYLEAFAHVIGCPNPVDPLTGPPQEHGAGADPVRMVAVIGRAAGSVLSAPPVPAAALQSVPCPPGLAGLPGIYAMIVDGTSMVPRFMPGEPVFADPSRPASPGDCVIVRVKGANGAPQAFVKRFVGQDEKFYHLDQFEKAHGGVKNVNLFQPRSSVTALHRIAPLNEMFGIYA